MVKDCGKKLANTIRTNHHVPPPGPGVPPAQVIVRPILLPLNAPPLCQWSIATAVVPNAGQCSWASPKRTCSPGESPSLEHCRTTERWPMLLGQPKTYLLPRRIPKLRTLPHPQARLIPKLRTILHPQARLIPNLGLVSVWAISTCRKSAHQPANIPGQIQSGPSMGILGTPLGIKHAPANPPGLINLPGQEDIPVQIQVDPPMGILGRPMGMRHAPQADIVEAVAPKVEDPLIQSFDVARRVRQAVSGLSQISWFFWQ